MRKLSGPRGLPLGIFGCLYSQEHFHTLGDKHHFEVAAPNRSHWFW